MTMDEMIPDLRHPDYHPAPECDGLRRSRRMM